MNTGLSTLSRRILFCGNDDWVYIAEAISLAAELMAQTSNEELRNATILALRELVTGGYVRIGDVTRSGFVAWTCSAEEAVERVEQEWIALGSPGLGDIAWLQNTAEGKKIGATVRDWGSWPEKANLPHK